MTLVRYCCQAFYCQELYPGLTGVYPALEVRAHAIIRNRVLSGCRVHSAAPPVCRGQVVAAYPEMDCYKTDHIYLMVVATCGLVIYCLG